MFTSKILMFCISDAPAEMELSFTVLLAASSFSFSILATVLQAPALVKERAVHDYIYSKYLIQT